MSASELPDNRIAIVGRACRVSGARDVSEYWRMLDKGQSATSRLSDADLLAAGVSRRKLADPNYVKAANILPDMECFDAEFFGFSPKEARILDPQHRHFLECAWEALEDAGHVPNAFDGRIGVFGGCGFQAYFPFNLLSNKDLVEENGLFLLRHTGNDKDFLPTRASYVLNLQGPSVAVQTACSTSLVAVHLGVTSLLNMECDMVLAGGVTIEVPHREGYTFAPNEVLSPDGLCRAFDDAGSGTIFGSGATMVALRRYEDAVADGDDIKAVILSSAINNDGSQKANYFAPSVEGQAEAIAEAVALSGVEPDTISYIEAHGTGTNLGDPIELTALNEVYGENDKGSLAIGSVKTNIGHLDTAAGGASLIKVVESMRNKRIPATLNFKTPNSRFDFENSPFDVASDARDWTPSGVPRRAGINSLGVGGTNAHIIVEEAPAVSETPVTDEWRLFPFSTKTKAALANTTHKWAGFLKDQSDARLDDIAYTLRNGRQQFNHRMAIAAKSESDLQSALDGNAHELVVTAQAADEKPEIVFLFAGGGAQYAGACADLMDSSPVFAAAVEECFAALPKETPKDLRALMFDGDPADPKARQSMNATTYGLPALFILQYAYSKLLESWGVKPDAILAHSLGEYAGAVVAGTMSMKDAIKIVTLRGQAMEAAPVGAMTSIPASEEQVRDLVGADLDIAALNAPNLSVVSGPLENIEALEEKLRNTDLEANRINVSAAAHSRLLDGQLEPFRNGIKDVRFSEPSVPFVSSTRGDWGQDDDFKTADYWVRHLRGTVRFVDAAAKVLEKPNRIIIEVGPGQALGPLVEMMEAENAPKAVVYCGRKPKAEGNDCGIALAAFGGLWANGVDVNWDALPGIEGRRVSVPTYAFEKNVHWIEPGKATAGAEDDDNAAVEFSRIEHTDDWFSGFEWREAPASDNGLSAGETVLVFAGNDDVSTAVVSKLKADGLSPVVAYRGNAYEAGSNQFTLRAKETADFDEMFTAIGNVPSKVLFLWPLDGADDGFVFDSAFNVVRALQVADPSEQVALVMAGTEATNSDGLAITNPSHAMMIGPVRVAPREISGLTSKYVDLPVAGNAETLASGLLAELVIADGNDKVSLRGATRLAEANVPVKLDANSDVRPKTGGTYLITGGQTGIGRQLALWLAEHYKAQIAIVSRSAKRDSALLKQIESFGGRVGFYKGDVTKIDSLENAKSEIENDLGAINGVVHAAGTIDDAPLSMKDLDNAHAVLAPKVDGAINLGTLFPEGSVDLFGVFSSSSVILGPPGQTDYVAANAFLEAFAMSRSDGLSIAWGIWRDIGMAAENYGVSTASGKPQRLLGSRKAEGDAIVFERGIDPNAEWVLTGHVINGQKILPGVAYIDLIENAAREVLGAKPFEIQSLSLMSPLAFPNDLPRSVTVKLSPVLKGFDILIQSSSGSESGNFIEHARATILVVSRVDGKQPESLSNAVKGQPLRTSTTSAQSDLVEFGDRWDNVKEIAVYEEQATGSYALAPSMEADTNLWRVHPGLLDTAATVGLDLLSDAERASTIYAPMSIDRIRVFAPIPPSIRSRAYRTRVDANRFASFDVEILDDAGEPLMYLEGFAMRGIDADALGSVESDLSLTEQMLAKGISAADAPALFEQIFTSSTNRMVASSLPLDLVKLSLVQASKPKSSRAEGSSVDLADLGNEVENWLANLWSDLLGAENLSAESDFFALGGHSLNAVRMFSRIRKKYEIDLPLATLFEAPTLGQLSELIISRAGIDVSSKSGSGAPAIVRQVEWSPLVKIKAGEPNKTPLFCVHGAGGNVLNFRSLSGYLRPETPFIGVRSLGSDGGPDIDETVEAMAERYLAAVREHQPMGPYWLAGYSGGGLIAYEMTQMLKAEGEKVENLIFFDTLAAHVGKKQLSFLEKLWAARNWDVRFALEWLERKKGAKDSANVREEIDRLLAAGEPLPSELTGQRMTDAFVRAQAQYEAKPYDGNIVIFKALRASTQFLAGGKNLGWDKVVSGDIQVHDFDCDHFTMMSDPAISKIGELLNEIL